LCETKAATVYILLGEWVTPHEFWKGLSGAFKTKRPPGFLEVGKQFPLSNVVQAFVGYARNIRDEKLHSLTRSLSFRIRKWKQYVIMTTYNINGGNY